MTIAPARESNPALVTEPVEVLIKGARRRGRRHYLATGVIALVVAAVIGVLAFNVSKTPTRVPTRTKPTVPIPVVLTNAPSCSSSALLVSFEGALAGGGSWNDLFTMRNTSDHACALVGYPAVRFISTTRRAISIPLGCPKGGCTHLGCAIGGIRHRGVLPKAILAAHSGVRRSSLKVLTFRPGVHIKPTRPYARSHDLQIALPHSLVGAA